MLTRQTNGTRIWLWWLVTAALLALTFLAPLTLPWKLPVYLTLLPESAYRLSLLAGVLTMVSLGIAIGQSAKNSMIGILLDGRNLSSLSRSQMALWTAISFGALLGAIGCRLGKGSIDVLAIQLPNELLAAMGISYVSAAAAPAILALKSQDAGPVDGGDAMMARRETGIVARGAIISRTMAKPPSLKDFVMGDDVTNAGAIDLSKVQQIIVTLILVGTYFLMLWKLFGQADFPGKLTKFPDMNQSFVNLMLMSHAGYLAYKAVSKPPGATPELQRPAPPDRNGGIPS